MKLTGITGTYRGSESMGSVHSYIVGANEILRDFLSKRF